MCTDDCDNETYTIIYIKEIHEYSHIDVKIIMDKTYLITRLSFPAIVLFFYLSH